MTPLVDVEVGLSQSDGLCASEGVDGAAALPDGYRAIISRWGPQDVPFEILPDRLSKAVGMEAVSIGVPHVILYGCGDSNNDVEAVARAAVGVRYWGRCELWLRLRRYCRPAVGDDGLAWALAAAGLVTRHPARPEPRRQMAVTVRAWFHHPLTVTRRSCLWAGADRCAGWLPGGDAGHLSIAISVLRASETQIGVLCACRHSPS